MDQAEKLRQIIDNLKTRQQEAQTPEKRKTAKVITVTSGKGGVGKTSMTINLALALAELGQRVVILDVDFGLANVDILFGIIPKYTLVDVIYNNKNILEVLTDGPQNIKFVSGGSGVEELVKLDHVQRERFLNNIALLDKICDIILIDTGAGLSENVMSFVMASDEILLVTTPEPTSITDAYALVKMVANRDRTKKINVLVNRAETIGEAVDILDKLTMVAQKFLSIKVFQLGYILHDIYVMRAIKQQQPFLMGYPRCDASRLIRDVAKNMTETDDMPDTQTGVRTFINRLVGFFGQA